MPDLPGGLRHAVLFLAYRSGGEELAGTAFYVTSSTNWNPDTFPPETIPSDYATDPERYGWLVTARHVIEGIQSKSDDGRVLLLVNNRDGLRVQPYPEVDASEWIQMPNDSDTGYLADIALLPFAPSTDYSLLRHQRTTPFFPRR